MLSEAATLLIRGINQVCSSGALRRVFLYILRSGILLNVGVEATSSTAGAASTCIHGFALSSLAKVAQTKAFVGGITFLQYIVQCIEVCDQIRAASRDPTCTCIRANKPGFRLARLSPGCAL